MKPSPAHSLRAFSACLTSLLLAAPVAAAATPDEEKIPLNLGGDTARDAAAQPGAGGGGIVRLIVGLAVVIGVIYGLAWVLRQVKASREGSAAGTGLESLSTLPLGPNRSVHLVRVGQELVLLGAAEKGVTTIRTYREDEARAAGLLPEDVDADVVDAVPDVVAATRPAARGTAIARRPGAPTASPALMLDALRRRTVRK